MSILRTERTIVDLITLRDAAFFVALVNSPDWIRYIGDRGVSEVSDARRLLERSYLKCYRDNGYGYYLVRTAAGVPIGITGFLNKPSLENPDFGFAMLPDYRGQGLAYESSFAVLNFGIATYAFTELDAVVALDNFPSIRLLEKLRFRRQGPAAARGESDRLALYRWRKSV